MKNILKLFVAILAISATSSLNAQQFGIKGGVNLANLLAKNDTDGTYSEDFKSLLGFHAGVTVDFPINDLLSFQTGALLSQKGYKIEEEDKVLGAALKASSSIMYVDIPLHLKASFGVGGLKVYGLAGPYIGIGLSGKDKTELTIAGQTTKKEEDITFGSEKEDVKRLDYGLSVGAGIEINHITLGATYNLGLASVSNITEDSNKVNTRVFQVSVGYKF